jgi:hypothetical protein
VSLFLSSLLAFNFSFFLSFIYSINHRRFWLNTLRYAASCPKALPASSSLHVTSLVQNSARPAEPHYYLAIGWPHLSMPISCIRIAAPMTVTKTFVQHRIMGYRESDTKHCVGDVTHWRKQI